MAIYPGNPTPSTNMTKTNGVCSRCFSLKRLGSVVIAVYGSAEPWKGDIPL
jgi:hypothetical protein